MTDTLSDRRRTGTLAAAYGGQTHDDERHLPLIGRDVTEPRPDLIHSPQDDALSERKQLIRQENDRGLSLTESVVHYFYRLTWRTPLHKLRLKGRSPLRLLAAPDDPFTGDPRRGKAIRAGHFQVAGTRIPTAKLDFTNLKAPDEAIEYIHSFAWLRDLAAAAPRATCVPFAEALVSQWLDAHLETVSDPAWRADLAAKRILHCATHAPLILSSSNMVYRSRVLRNFASTARHLDHVADKAPEGLPRLTAWAGIVAAALLLPDGEPRRIFGEAGLKRAIETFMGEDGGALSRSALAQIEAIRVLSMLKSVYTARGEMLSPIVELALVRAVPALQGLTHHDGSLGSWQGAAAISAEAMSDLIRASGVRSRPLRQARHWGFQRIPAGRTVVLVDAGTPPMARHAVTGCASTLAFEMSHGPHRIIVNCGGAGVLAPDMPPSLTKGLRATAAHSTLCLDDSNSTAVLPKGQLGKGVGLVELDRRDTSDAVRLDMSHDGYVRRYGLTHRRLLVLGSDGRELRGEDVLLPTGRRGFGRGKGGETPFAIRFHLGLDVEAHLASDGLGIFLRIADGSLWQFRSASASVALEDSLWVDEHEQIQPSQQIVLSGTTSDGGGSYGWLFKHMG